MLARLLVTVSWLKTVHSSPCHCVSWSSDLDVTLPAACLPLCHCLLVGVFPCKLARCLLGSVSLLYVSRCLDVLPHCVSRSAHMNVTLSRYLLVFMSLCLRCPCYRVSMHQVLCLAVCVSHIVLTSASSLSRFLGICFPACRRGFMMQVPYSVDGSAVSNLQTKRCGTTWRHSALSSQISWHTR